MWHEIKIEKSRGEKIEDSNCHHSDASGRIELHSSASELWADNAATVS